VVLTNRFGVGPAGGFEGSTGGLVGSLAGGRSTGGWGGPEGGQGGPLGGQGGPAGGFLEGAVEEDLANGSTRIELLLPVRG